MSFNFFYRGFRKQCEKKSDGGKTFQLLRLPLTPRTLALAALMKAKSDVFLVFRERGGCWEKQACCGLRVSAIKRLSLWIIVKVAWVKLIAGRLLVLHDPPPPPTSSHTGSGVLSVQRNGVRGEVGRERWGRQISQAYV